MKNKIKFLGIIALVAVIGAMTACKEENTGGKKFWAEELKISGEQVYVEQDWEEAFSAWVTSGFSGNLKTKYDKLAQGAELPSTENYSLGSGSIDSKGKLSYTAGVPIATLLQTINSFSEYFEDWKDVEISDNTVKAFGFESFTTKSGDRVFKGTETSTIKKDLSTSGTYEAVSYFYVDKDVTITGQENVEEYGEVKETYKKFNLELKQGWNAIYQKSTGKGTFDAFFDDYTSGSFTTSISRSNPNLKWVLILDEDNKLSDLKSITAPLKALRLVK